MKTAFILVCFSFLLGGCEIILRTQKPLREVKAVYNSVQKGMTKEQVLARVDTPNYIDNLGTAHWVPERQKGLPEDQEYDFVELMVDFGPNGQVSGTFVGSGVRKH